MFYCCGITDTGTTREKNEDAFLINKIVMTQAQMESALSHPFIVGVADGVAGENRGEMASRLSLELLSNIKFSRTTNLKKKVNDIHENLRCYGISHEGSLNMQTTLCALAVDEDNVAYSVNVGDSRMYLFREKNLRQITKDQSLVELLYDSGAITLDEKQSHMRRNIIFPVLGNITSPPCTDIQRVDAILPGDLFLICTDGLSDYVPAHEIAEILSSPALLPKRLSLLVNAAIARGSRDNITIVAVLAGEEQGIL